MTIHRFDGEHFWLSNFYESPVVLGGITFSTAEHAFQAAKCKYAEDVTRIHAARTPGEAKGIGRKVTMRDDWEQVKYHVMVSVIRAKFEVPELADKLLSTGDQELVEGNTWGDRTWGRVAGKGNNWLGEILMERRELLRQERA